MEYNILSLLAMNYPSKKKNKNMKKLKTFEKFGINEEFGQGIDKYNISDDKYNLSDDNSLTDEIISVIDKYRDQYRNANKYFTDLNDKDLLQSIVNKL